ncbi:MULTISPECIES: murein biosynthesis integral membrane protein MurJ [Sphingomonadales]|uniref:Probable lipid II flippase MurJ n=1 Tax=Edaphosphingomonas haloaromaticamans TaxID=653954 RepID=A0A1S1HD73_9SPHN|nr:MULTISPECIES: murein biosynthesis integral membrane protein MurJ [Sphingomonas]AGH50789.1 virulence factor [Sphingomonas sp. MM-1]MDX3884830.1 murein biosynthesis integral membrane protein MurJ [Sphingomonas sp.]OHT19203.1 putative peptidoglycan biosynthesis protein MurJ [Sphingomonas haloaromaticamans]
MNLTRAIGTIGGLTMISRIFGFAREMLMSRIMGASGAADAFLVAFRLPNTFRRLFGEGAFSAGFVPLFSQRLHGQGGIEDARKFSEEVLAVFLPTLFLFTLVFEIAMPAFVWAIASGYADEPAKFALTVSLTRITFPYLLLISLVSLFSGVLNSLTKFAAAAFAPALLNVAMLGALILVPAGGVKTAYALAIGVTVGGVLQLALLWNGARRAGISLRLRRPRITPGVRQFFVVVIPATLGAGVYQISQLIDTFFATRLPEGSMSFLNYSDRLNQLPLSVIGTALGTAILPQISRFIARGEPDEAAKVQGQAVELSMLLCLPAALALAVVAGPLCAALFQGGKFTAHDAMVTGNVLAIIVAGLPAYVLVKVITPGFYAREDTKTPVKTAAIVLIANIVLNFALIPLFGIYGLAFAIAACSWLNCLMLYAILRARGHFRIEGWLWGRIARQIAAGLVMAAVLWALRMAFADWFAGSVGKRMISVMALVGIGGIVYFGAAWLFGGMDKEAIRLLTRRRRKKEA